MKQRSVALEKGLAHEAAQHRALADEAIASAPPYPADRFAGRGIVICASGLRYFVCAWICVRMLQRLGCELPIEFWALGADDWTPEMERLAREELGVGDCRMPRAEDRARFTDAWAESAGRAGWELKPYSIVESRFREVLLLDADIVPVVDPTFLFDSPQFAEHGAIFWPDPTPIGPERAAWEIMGVPYRGDVTMNSGQLLVDKARCWRALQLVLHYNRHSDFYFRHLHGDQDTFYFAWRKLGQSYAMPPFPVELLPYTFGEPDFTGRRIFQHRLRKWRFTQENVSIPGFLHEEECRAALNELREKWTSGFPTPRV